MNLSWLHPQSRIWASTWRWVKLGSRRKARWKGEGGKANVRCCGEGSFISWGPRRVSDPGLPTPSRQREEGERLPSSSRLPWLRAARGLSGHTLPAGTCWLACTQAWGSRVSPAADFTEAVRAQLKEDCLSERSVGNGRHSCSLNRMWSKGCDWDTQTSSTDAPESWGFADGASGLPRRCWR